MAGVSGNEYIHLLLNSVQISQTLPITLSQFLKRTSAYVSGLVFVLLPFYIFDVVIYS